MSDAQPFDADAAARRVIEAMRPLATPERAAQAKSYLKSDLVFLGVSVPGIRRTVIDEARSYPRLGRGDAIKWARALWHEPVHERRTAAIEVLRRYVKELEAADLALVEGWVRTARGWAYVDPLAGDIAGPIALRHQQAWPLIDAWARDEDFWVRRSALLTLLAGIRQGQPDLERFERYATPMLTEKEFFIRKAIGWVLRETSKKDPAYVAGWTERHLASMSGVTFREAVRRLPEALALPLKGTYLKQGAGKGCDSALFQYSFGNLGAASPTSAGLPVSYLPSCDRVVWRWGAWVHWRGRRNLPVLR